MKYSKFVIRFQFYEMKSCYDKDSKETDMNELISAMVGRSLDNRFPPVDNKPGEVIFSVENLSTKYAPKLQNISFDIRKGEIFGLYGLVGAGRTELLETIFGCVQEQQEM